METVESKIEEIREILKEFAIGLVRLENDIARLEKSIEKLEGEVEELKDSLKETNRQREEDRKYWEEHWKKAEKEREESKKYWNEQWEKSQKEREEDRKYWEEHWKKAEKEREESKKYWNEQWEKSQKEREEDRKYWEEKWKEINEQRKEDIKRFNKEWGALANRLGTIVEDIIFPAARPVLEKYFDCEITDIALNREKRKGDLQDEFDVIAVSDVCKTVFLIEVKSTPKIDYVDDFKNNKIERFRKLFYEYKDYKLIPIFASLRLQENIVNYLTKQNIYAMAYREWDYMDILNFDKLQN